MIKKIFVFVLMFVLLFPVAVNANDGGPEIDNRDFLTIEVIPKSDEAVIGGVFQFQIELTNNSSEKIDRIIISYIFSKLNIEYEEEYYDMGNFENELLPGEKLIVDVSVTIPYCIDWYKKDDEYYMDLDLVLNYHVFRYMSEMSDSGDLYDLEPYYGHINQPLKKIPIKISNLYDGSDYIDLVISDDEKIFNYICTYKSTEYSYIEYESILSDTIEIKNVSDIDIENMFFRNDEYYTHSFEQKTINIENNSTYTITPTIFKDNYDDKIASKLLVEYKVIFQKDNKYYVNSIAKTYPTEIIERPILDISLEKKEDTNQYFLEVTNVSGSTYNDFFFESNKDGYSFDKERYQNLDLIDVFRNGKTLNYNCSSVLIDRQEILVGYIRDEILYVWYIHFYDDFEEYRIHFKNSYIIEELLHPPTNSPTPTLSPNPTPSITPTSIPSPKTAIITTPVISPIITVISVEKKSSIPFWVWIVLSVAMIGAGVLIHVFRKKEKFKE